LTGYATSTVAEVYYRSRRMTTLMEEEIANQLGETKYHQLNGLALHRFARGSKALCRAKNLYTLLRRLQ
jgi:hypothetical protein